MYPIRILFHCISFPFHFISIWHLRTVPTMFVFLSRIEFFYFFYKKKKKKEKQEKEKIFPSYLFIVMNKRKKERPKSD